MAPDGAPRAHRASPRAPPARRRAAALLGEMVPGEWSETEDSDAVAADFEEPQLYRTMRGDSRTRRGRPSPPAATGRYRERLWSGAMGCRYHLLRRPPAEKKALQRAQCKEEFHFKDHRSKLDDLCGLRTNGQ